jgi:hypothetical protein
MVRDKTISNPNRVLGPKGRSEKAIPSSKFRVEDAFLSLSLSKNTNLSLPRGLPTTGKTPSLIPNQSGDKSFLETI